MTEGLRDAFAVPGDVGVLITEVFPGSPASRAGLRPGDVIVKMNRRSIRDMDDVQRSMDYLEPDEQMNVEIIREKQPEQLGVTLGERKTPTDSSPWRDWRNPYSEDPPFFTDPDWWLGIEEFMQRWRRHWEGHQEPEPRRAL